MHAPFPASTSHFPSPVFTYRYFLYRYPQLCILAVSDNSQKPIGCVVGKIDFEDVETGALQDDDGHDSGGNRQITGYIGMLAVTESFRRRGIGQALVQRVLERMKSMGCVSAMLETEVSNKAAQRLYQDRLGFIREELLVRYYLNWNDAYRLRLWFR